MIKPLLLGFSSLVLGACATDGSDGPSKDEVRAQGKTDDGHEYDQTFHLNTDITGTEIVVALSRGKG